MYRIRAGVDAIDMLNKHRARGGRAAFGRIATVAVGLVRDHQAMRRAAKRMPKPVPWAWAQPRLLPLLAGPRLDGETEPLVRSVERPGCAVVFGIDLGGVFTLADVPVAERWECTSAQIRDVAFKNLRSRTAVLGPRLVTAGTLSGRIVRVLEGHGGWAASVLLLPDQLMRLFGEHDQIFVALSHGRLLSFPIDTPPVIVANILMDFEMNEIRPLLLDAFILIDRKLLWQDDGESYEEE
jgi:hypothetical protein